MKNFKKKFTWVTALLLAQLSSLNMLLAQEPPYPIIFVHGIGSDDQTWEETITFLRDTFGWDDPYANNDQGIFHALLNASDLSTHYGMDVRTTFPNEQNDLYNGNIFAINFKNWWDPVTQELKPRDNSGKISRTESNESAITKQGYALGLMIKKVIETTGSQKVILVCHSMGGLAAREYLQRVDTAGKPKWWAYPEEAATGHRVAKLVTIGTPHWGSNATDWAAIIAINPNSEASRDLHYHYTDSYEAGEGVDIGVYLFGGSETRQELLAKNFHNNDIDSDGDANDEIIGLNSPTILWFDNRQMQLPPNIAYTWIASDHGNSEGDKAVRLSRQFLLSKGDTLQTNRFHWDETADYRSIIRGLDEPGDPGLAYEIALGQSYHFLSDFETKKPLMDTDWFTFELSQMSAVAIDVANLPTSGNNATVSVALFAENNLQKTLVSGINEGGKSAIVLNSDMLPAGHYALRIVSAPQTESWKNPGILKVDLSEPVHQGNIKITDTSGNAENPAIAVAPNGTSHIVWQDARIGNWEIFFSKLDANGAFLMQDIRITDSAGSSTKPDVSTDANGNTYIVWRERDEIFFCVLDATGLKIVSDVQISAGDADNPAISTIASGRSHIVWQRRQISSYYVYFARVDAAGQKIGGDLRLADWDIIGAINNFPAIDNDASGNSYILWRYRNTGILPLDHALFYAKINDDGSIAARLRVLNQPKADYTAIAVASPYLFLVHSDDRGNGRGIFSITNVDQDYRVDAGGVNAIQTTVGYDATQNAYIAWSDERDGNREIYLAHINPSNQKEGTDLRITATAGNSSWPDIDMDGSGNYLMVWQDNSDGDWDIWMTRGPAAFVPPGQSDLTISQVEGPASATAGTQVDISVTVNLSGDPLTSGAFVLVRVYASVDDVFDNSDLLIGESTETQFLITTLNIIGGATESISCSLPQAAGNYRYIAVVDPADFQRESDETNNIFSGNRVTTTPPGKVWHISTTGDDDSGTGSPDKPFARIQKGIEQAAHGDTVLVSPGVYFESINFLGKNIVVGSHFLRTQDESFIEQTVIDAGKEPTDRSVVYLVNRESEQAELVGLTLQNGRGSYASYPNHHGGGISLHRGARPKIRYCHIKNNTSSYEGGGVFCNQGIPLLQYCTISGNSARRGGGIIFINTSPRLENCTIVENNASDQGGAIYNWDARPTVVNSILWGNQAQTGNQVRNRSGSVTSISFSDIQGGYPGAGNIDADPLFCAPPDYRLSDDSPCIGAGANGENMGANAVGCDVVTERFILGFPLASDPYSMAMTAIFDHSMSKPYETPSDGFVVAFSGDSGIADLGYKQRNGEPFVLNGNYYKGLEHSKILEYEGHSGIDFDANIGSIVYAAADGEVTKVVKDKPDNGQGEGYGNYITIQHAGGYVTLYGHLKQNSTDLKEKDMVKRGSEIALSGNSGKSTGDHLHFEVRKNGTVVDPYGWQGFDKDPYTQKTGFANIYLWDVSTKQTEWTFDETFEKWRTRDALNKGVNVALGGKWVLDPGSDPGIISPTLTNIDAAQFKKVELRMAANGSGETTVARLFFKTSPGQQFKVARSAAFTPDVLRDGSQRTYTADLAGHALWQGQIVEIRIDPIENGDAVDKSDLLYIDYVKFVHTSTAIAEQSDSQPPSEFFLSQNYPNPFNPETTIEFALPEPGHVTLTIYNTLGQLVRVVLNKKMPTGNWAVKWNGRDRKNQPVPSGIYLYRMVAGKFAAMRKLMVVR